MTNHPRSHGAKFKVGQVVFDTFWNLFVQIYSRPRKDGYVCVTGCGEAFTHVDNLRPLTKKEAGR